MCEAAREQTTSTGATSLPAPLTSWPSWGRRASESKITRSGWSAAEASGTRAVSSGSSASAVPRPTATASQSTRQRCTRARLASPEIQCESPVRVATLPSSVMASLSTTWGQPVRACFRNGWLIRRAARATSPSTVSTSMPSSRSTPRPRPLTFAVGSSEATTTRLIPASRIASVHGGVRPVWAHGSSETYMVAPAGSSVQAPSATRSAWGSPAAAWNPSPITRPDLTTTAPTRGLGPVCPRASEARSTVLSRWR